MRIKQVLFLIAIVFIGFTSSATNRTSTGNGNWSTAGTWSPSGIPVVGDNITILSGNTVTMDGNTGSCNNLTINGTANWSQARTTNVGGNLVVNNGATLGGSNNGTLNVTGTFNIPSGASVTITNMTISVSGSTTVDGTFNITSTGGTKTFADVTVSSTGNWNASVSEVVTVNGNFTSSGTFETASGTYAISGNLSVNSGTTNYEGTIGGTLTIASGATMNLPTGSCSVTGLTTVSGTLNITTTTGTKTFADVIVNSSGDWNSTVAEAATITGNFTTSGTFETASGTYAISGNLSVNSGTTNYEGSVGGTLTIASGAVMNLPTGNCTVTGSTTVSGSLNFITTTGTKSFADVTINSGGTWSSSIAENYSISGNITNNGTFTSNSGTYTLAGTSKTISGTLSISKVSVTGSYTNNGDLSVPTSLAGAGSLIQGISSTLNIGGTSTISTLDAITNIHNLVNYNGTSAQSIKAINYYDLQVSTATGVNATFAGSSTINDIFFITSGIARTGANTITVTGSTNISGTLQINSTTGTKTFGDIIVNSAGFWDATVAEAITVNGSISNSGTFTSNTGIYTLAGASKTISGTLSITNVTVTGSYTNNGSFTVVTTLVGGGSFSQGSNSTLNISATAANFSVPTFNASALGNTVNYNLAGIQSVRIPSDGAYNHLTISGSNTKTLLAATTVNGNLTISAGTLSANNFNMNVGGNWSNSGTFTPGTNRVTFNGSGAQTITKSGGETFNILTIAGSGIKTLGSAITTNGNLTISSTLDVSASNYGVTVKGTWTNNGTFTERSGTVTFSGAAAQTIGGSTTTNFYNITQSNAAGVSISHAQNLLNVLTISSGTFSTGGNLFTLVSNSSGTGSIAAIPAGANFSGSITMQRYTGNGPTDWRFLCSPVSGATIADWSNNFATTGFTGATCNPSNCATSGCAATCNWCSIWTYNETVLGSKDSGFVAATNVTNPLTVGKGFWVYMGGNPLTFDVVGPPNTFSQSPSITYTNSGSITDDGWNMIANPYPSAIDWNSGSWTKTNLDNAIYVYNSSTGSYASYISGVGVNGGSQYIPSSQAFWVKANAASPAITIVENVKASSNPIFMREANSQNVSQYPMAFKDFPIPLNANTTPNSIKLIATGNGFEDETFVRFTQGATNNFDGAYDAWKLQSVNPSSPNISSVINDTTDLSINSLPALTSDMTVKIRLLVPATGTYSIRRDSTLMLPMSSCIILEDLANGNMIDLRSNISYSFTISDTTTAPRFLLHIAAPIAKQEMNTRCSYDSSGIAIATGTGNGPWNYVWKDSLGNVLQTKNNSSVSDTLFHLPVGTYSVQVSGSACGIVNDTFQIKSSSSLAAFVNYTDVSCYGANDGTATATVISGISPFNYLWSNGSTTQMLSNLTIGNYSVTVTDSLGCFQKQFAVIAQPAQVSAAFSPNPDTVYISTSSNISFMNNSSGATNYLWDFGDTTSVDSSLNPVHYFNYTGTYTVMLAASSGNCSDTARKTVLVLDSLLATSVPQNNSSSSVNVVYGNGQVYLDFNLPNAQDVTISIYDMLGEKISSQFVPQVQKNRIKLNTENISSGIYLSVSSMKSGLLTKRIVITRR